MTTLSLVLLGVIAVCALIQAVFLTVLVVALVRAGSRIDELKDLATREIPRLARDLSEVTARLAETAQRTREGVERTEAAVATVAKVTRAAGTAARTAARIPLLPFHRTMAFVHAVRRAVGVYRLQAPPAP